MKSTQLATYALSNVVAPVQIFFNSEFISAVFQRVIAAVSPAPVTFPSSCNDP